MRGLLVATLVVGAGAGALAAAGWLADSPANPGPRAAPTAARTELAAAAPAVAPGPTAPVPAVQQQALAEPPRAAPTATAVPPEPAAAAAPPPPAPAPVLAPAADTVAAAPIPTVPPATQPTEATPAAPAAPVATTPPAPTPAPQQQLAALPPPAAVDAAAPVVAPAVPATPAPVPQAALAQPPAATGTTVPTFDVVRVNPNGRAVIAGRAAPEAEVTVQLGNDAVATTKADRFGEWVAIPSNPLPQGPHELTLQSVTPAGVRSRSDQVVTLVVPYTNVPAPERPFVIVQDREGIIAPRVLQAPPADTAAASPPGVMTLDAVQYDQGGNVVLAGRARLGTDVRVYVDDRPVGVVAADAGGQWQLTPDNTLAVGRHELRLEQFDGGILMSKMELPFMRAPPEAIRTLAPGEIIVQPGTSLWRIARNTYGRGTLYTVIYLANAEQIQNPDLIYPGQVFALPPVQPPR